jgi:hypothetical protein
MITLYSVDYALLGIDGEGNAIQTPVVVYEEKQMVYEMTYAAKYPVSFYTMPMIDIKWPTSYEEPTPVDVSVDSEAEDPETEIDPINPSLVSLEEAFNRKLVHYEPILVSTKLKLKPKTKGCNILTCSGDGTCGFLLHTKYYIELEKAFSSGACWGDLVEEGDFKSRPVQRKRQRQQEINKKDTIEMEPERQLQLEKMKNFLSLPEKKKEYEPCRNLYGYNGKSKYVCSECYGHEFTDCMSKELVDERTGDLLPRAYKESLDVAIQEGYVQICKNSNKYVLQYRPRTCNKFHPGEKGWDARWFTKNPYGGK